MRRLLIRPGGIGDCILCFPAMEYVRASFTEVWISSAVVPIVQFADRVCSIASTGIDSVGLPDLPMPDYVRDKLSRFDSIVSWYGAARPEFRSAMESLNVPCVFHSALPPAYETRHAVDFFAAQVGAPQGLVPRLHPGPQPGRDTIVIHPFSGGARKNWPLENYCKLAGGVGFPVEWAAGPDENLAGARQFEDLDELARWMAAARLYIGNDSGVTHLAAATGMSVLALFGPTDPAVWAPRGPNVIVMRWEPIAALPVSACLAKVRELLPA